MGIQCNALVSNISKCIIDAYPVELDTDSEVGLPRESVLAVVVGNSLEIVESAADENQVAITEFKSESRVNA